ncbi:MAG: hypothetical protein CL434_12535 [Acidimicrobiaceae bacterium]|nr:hypothetical protein [Acidimicrobiaceae bacterium]
MERHCKITEKTYSSRKTEILHLVGLRTNWVNSGNRRRPNKSDVLTRQFCPANCPPDLGNVELGLELWTVIHGISGFDD